MTESVCRLVSGELAAATSPLEVHSAALGLLGIVAFAALFLWLESGKRGKRTWEGEYTSTPPKLSPLLGSTPPTARDCEAAPFSAVINGDSAPTLRVLIGLMVFADIVAGVVIGVLLFVNGHPWWGVAWFFGLGELVMWPVAMAGCALLTYLAALRSPTALPGGTSADRVTRPSNSKARAARLWCALAALSMFALMGLFPPWSREDGTTVYSPIFSRPPCREWHPAKWELPRDSPDWKPREWCGPEDAGHWESFGVTQIDLMRLLVQAFVVASAAAGVFVIVSLRERR
ncbi:MAG: hypothetical protein HYY18_09290 [Planctomycetes bacterium]|nr:hypothetical protein [Planctomycetota bacterium]